MQNWNTQLWIPKMRLHMCRIKINCLESIQGATTLKRNGEFSWWSCLEQTIGWPMMGKLQKSHKHFTEDIKCPGNHFPQKLAIQLFIEFIDRHITNDVINPGRNPAFYCWYFMRSQSEWLFWSLEESFNWLIQINLLRHLWQILTACGKQWIHNSRLESDELIRNSDI